MPGPGPRPPSSGAVMVTALTLAVSACATHHPRSVADRFVVGAPEVVEPAGPVDGAAAPAIETPAQAPEPDAATVSSLPSIVSTTRHSLTLEEADGGLAAALSALEVRPSAESHRQVAVEYWRLRVFDKAERHVSRALALAPEDAGAYDLRARVWRDWGLPEYALGDASRAVYYAPQSPVTHNTLATLLVALNQLDEADASLKRAMALAPDAAFIRSNLCYVALLRGRHTEAADHCDAALARDGTLVPAWNNRALVLADDGRMEEAWADFARGGGEGVAHYNAGLVWLSQAAYLEAADAFDRALEADAGLPLAAAYAAAARRLANGKGR